MFTRTKSIGLCLILALGLQSINSADTTTAPTLGESTTPIDSTKSTIEEPTQSTMPIQTPAVSQETTPAVTQTVATTVETSKAPVQELTTTTITTSTTSEPESTNADERIYKSSTSESTTTAQTTLSQASNAQSTPTFESIKNNALILKNTISTIVDDMSPSDLEKDENTSWWINFVSNKNKTMTFFDDLKKAASSALTSGSSETNMNWWNDLKTLKTAIQSMSRSETDNFKLNKLRSAEQSANNIETSISQDIGNAINSLDKITQKVTTYLKSIEDEMADARDETKAVSEHSMATSTASNQRANATQRSKPVTRQVQPKPSMSRGSAPQAAPVRQARAAKR